MTSEEWIKGKTAGPKLISLEAGFVPAPAKEFVTSASLPNPTVSRDLTHSRANSMSEKEYKETVHALIKENEDLKNIVAQRDIRIRQLESKLGSVSLEQAQ